MILKENHVIIHNTKKLNLYKFDYLDKNIVDLFENKWKDHSETSQRMALLAARRLNCFLGITNQKLTLLKLKNSKQSKNIVSDFLYFTKNKGFGFNTTNNREILRITRIVMNQLFNINSDKRSSWFPISKSFNYQLIDEKQVHFFNGWIINKNGNIFYDFIEFHKFFGEKKTNKVFDKLKLFTNNKGKRTVCLSVNTLNQFLKFLSTNQSLPNQRLYNEFMVQYFTNAMNEKLCIESKKKEWNEFSKTAADIFGFDSLAKKVTVKTKKGFERNVSHIHGQDIKEKLITDIPLELTDKDAMDLLFKKIDQDLSIVKKWANNTFDKAYDNFKKSDRLPAYNEYNKTTAEISKLRDLKERAKINDLFDTDSFITRKVVLALIHLLTIEHPEITESFLINLKLYDRDKISCLHKHDKTDYLVGYKSRKGKLHGEQKILLTNTSHNLIHKYIEMTHDMRKGLKEDNNFDYQNLFLFSATNTLTVSSLKRTSSFNLKNDYYKSLISFLITNEKMNSEEAVSFAKKITPTKIRASRGVQIYIKTESVTKMAEALGHRQHNPDLLSHYLPEPILEYFQKRWVLIFQKGIICEAMKDSKFLLKASGFKTMSQLDDFLKTHALQNIPNCNRVNEKEEVESDIYIGINEDILKAVLSLNKAVVESTKQSKLDPKAIYWANFAEKLKDEINSNNAYVSFRKTLHLAEKNLNPREFEEVIYVA